MQYLLAIVYDPSNPPTGPSKQPEHAALEREMRAAGHYLSGSGLQGAEQFSKRVHRRGGRPMVSDGPFAETREALGGYFIVECSEDEAIEWAKRIPVDEDSFVEVRRVFIYRPGDRPQATSCPSHSLQRQIR